MITDEQEQELLAASPAPRVTVESMQSRIISTTFTRMDETVTICNLKLDNGYSVRGESACVNPENYNQAIGEKIAYDAAFNKLWPLFGFLLAEQQHIARQAGQA